MMTAEGHLLSGRRDSKMALPWRCALTLMTLWTLIRRSHAGNCSAAFERTPGMGLPPSDDPNEFLLSLQTSPTECYQLCIENPDCRAYLLDHDNSTCLLTGLHHPQLLGRLRPHDAWSYHRKMCLEGEICGRQWTFDRIPGVQLYGFDDKIVKNVEEEDGCLKACSVETDFVCRSARYDYGTRYCFLSRHDRRTAPEAFRRSQRRVDYLENQCVSGPTKCLFRQHKGRKLVRQHMHVESEAVTQELCEKTCLNHTDFTCRSFSFDPSLSLCLLSPEDSYSLPDGALEFIDNHYYYERESCINVEMRCEATAMSAIVHVPMPFRGRVYALGYPYECYSSTATEDGLIAINLPLHGRRCGTRNLGNGTFINSVVVQHHPFVLRSSDRRVDIACDYEEVQRKLRGGKQVLEGDLQTLTQVVTGLAPTPPVRLRVVNSTGEEVTGVELGAPLYLRVEILDESVFGIFGSGLVARSGQGTESVLLIDDRGCPVEPTVFPALERIPGSKSLATSFQAFRFASDSMVKFQMTVSFCLDVCPPVKCEDGVTNEVLQSYGKRRRRSSNEADPFHLQSGDVVTDVMMESSMFVVNNLKPAQTGDGNKQQGLLKKEVGRDTVHMSEQGLCLTRAALYTVAIVVGVVQLAVFGACTLVFLFTRKPRGGRYPRLSASSRASISSKTDLFNRS